MQLIGTTIKKLGEKHYCVTLCLASDEPIETARESIMLKFEVQTVDDTPLLAEVQGAALVHARDAIGREIQVLQDAALPPS